MTIDEIFSDLVHHSNADPESFVWQDDKRRLLATILAALPKQRNIPLSDMEVSDASRNLTLDEVQEALEELFK